MVLSDISIRRPVFATMLMVALVVLGVVAYGRLAIDEYPDVSYPIVVVQTPYPGASPEVVEREVSRPIEEALNTVQGIQEITSTSFEGSSLVRVQLQLGVDVMQAQQEVLSKIARMRRQLPEDIEDGLVATHVELDRVVLGAYDVRHRRERDSSGGCSSAGDSRVLEQIASGRSIGSHCDNSLGTLPPNCGSDD